MAEVKEKEISPGAVVAIGVGLGGIAVLGLAALVFAAPPAPPLPPPGKANLYGRVVDAETGKAIPDVLVTLDSMQASTGASGDYLFPDLEPGGYYISFEKEGYEAVSGDITLLEGNNPLNVGLTPLVANLFGVVTDAETGLALGGVLVTLDDKQTSTDASGSYAFPNIEPGDYLITFEKDGYETVSGVITLLKGDNTFNVAMTKVPELPPELAEAAENYIEKWGNGGYEEAVEETYELMGEDYTVEVVASDEVLAAARSWNPASNEATIAPESSPPEEATDTIDYTDFGGGYGYSERTGPVTPYGYGW
ncbi:hypothetical protein ES708_31810 [subsurface metagenome]